MKENEEACIAVTVTLTLADGLLRVVGAEQSYSSNDIGYCD